MQITIDDNLYQNLVAKVGQANISHYVQSVLTSVLSASNEKMAENESFTSLTGIEPFTTGKHKVTDKDVQIIREHEGI